MIIPFILSVIAWPIVTLLGNLLISKFLMPIFNLTHNPTDKVGYRVADIFQALSLIGSQIIAVLSAKGIYSLFQSQATAWLAIPFGLLCFLFGPMAGPIDDRLQAKYEGKCPGDLERHVGWSWAVGLGIGWVVGSILLLL
jgi:hypothetical protein